MGLLNSKIQASSDLYNFPINCFKGVYFCIAFCRKKAFWGTKAFYFFCCSTSSGHRDKSAGMAIVLGALLLAYAHLIAE